MSHFLWKRRHIICYLRAQLEKAFREVRDHMRRKRKLSDWILILLIVAFFAIPVCSIALTEEITSWPKCNASFICRVIGK